MEEKEKNEAAQPKKFTYEQLESIATNLSTQVQQLSARLQESNMFNIFKRLDYCFKVAETDAKAPGLFTPEFVARCVREIEEIMTPPTTAPIEVENKEE